MTEDFRKQGQQLRDISGNISLREWIRMYYIQREVLTLPYLRSGNGKRSEKLPRRSEGGISGLDNENKINK